MFTYGNMHDTQCVCLISIMIHNAFAFPCIKDVCPYLTINMCLYSMIHISQCLVSMLHNIYAWNRIDERRYEKVRSEQEFLVSIDNHIYICMLPARLATLPYGLDSNVTQLLANLLTKPSVIYYLSIVSCNLVSIKVLILLLSKIHQIYVW